MEDKMNAKESKIFSDRDQKLPTDIVDISNTYRVCERRVKAAVESPGDLQLESVGLLIRTNLMIINYVVAGSITKEDRTKSRFPM
ncbi:hypothetical protein OROGR_027337 [Orobanche gracilis]